LQRSNTSEFSKFRVAVLGYKGIGKHHIQVLKKLGVIICGILTSSETSGTFATNEIQKEFGIHTKAYTNLDNLIFNSKPQAIHICTPNELHFSNILKAFDKNIPVLCEKPLIWNESITKEEIDKKLLAISNHPNRRIFLNTSNSSIISQIRNSLTNIKNVRSFEFEFDTNGKYKFNNIAFDLFPHGLAMLQEIAGTSTRFNDFAEYIEEHKYACTFKYKSIDVSFKFCQNKNLKKRMEFCINNNRYQRLQNIKNQDYSVSIKDFKTKKIFEIKNPLESLIIEFLKFCINKNNRKRDGYENASWNLSMMSEMLLNDDSF
jgi:hypothetical protein